MFEWHAFCLECISLSLHFGIKIYCVEWGALETAPGDEGMAPDNLQHLRIIKDATPSRLCEFECKHYTNISQPRRKDALRDLPSAICW